MLFAFLLWIYISILSAAWGFLFIDAVKLLTGIKREEIIPLPVLCFLGLGLMSFFALVMSLFIPVGLAAQVFVLLAAAGFIFFRRRFVMDEIKKYRAVSRNMSGYTAALFLAVSFLVLFGTSMFYPASYDTALYHAQAIRWIEHYPAVPGLGNFNMQLGYNSAWFISQALFSFSFIPGVSFHVLNGLVLVWAAAFFLGGMDKLLKGDISFSGIIKVLLLPVSFYLYAPLSSSPSTDMPAALLIWLLFLLFLDNASGEKSFGKGAAGFIIVFLTAYLTVIKLSGVPLVMLLFYVLVRQYKDGNKKAVLFSAGLFISFLLPWLARNVIQTGYLIYPLDKIDLFSFDWKVPAAAVQYDSQWIGLWAFKKPAGMGPLNYIPLWLGRLALEQKILFYPLLVMAGLSMIFIFYRIFRKRPMPGRLNGNKALMVLLTGLAGILFLFFTAPSFRFGAGYLMFACFFPIGMAFYFLLMHYGRLLIKMSPYYAVMLLLLFFCLETFSAFRYFDPEVRSFYEKDKPGNLVNRVVLPAPYPENDKNKMVSFQFPPDIVLYVPKIGDGAYCWYDPFPSGAYYYQDIQLRGKSLREGFRRLVK